MLKSAIANSWITHSLKRPPLCWLSTGTVSVYSMLWREREKWHYSLSIVCETSETYCTIKDFSILKELQCLCYVQSPNELVNRNTVARNGGSRTGVWGEVKLGGAKNVFTCLNAKGCLRQSLCVTQKRLSFVGQKVASFVGRTMLFFRE